MLVISSGSYYTMKYKPGVICVVTPPFILVSSPMPSPWTSHLLILGCLSHLSRQDLGVRLHAGGQGHQDIPWQQLHRWCHGDQPLPGGFWATVTETATTQRTLNTWKMKGWVVTCSASSVSSPAALPAHQWVPGFMGQRAECSQVNGKVWGIGNWFDDDDWVWWLSGSSPVIVVVWSLSCVRLFATPWTAAHQSSLSPTISWKSSKFMSIESVMPSNHLILCHPLLLLPSIFPSIRVFFNELALHIRWPKYWNLSFSISPSKQYSGLISFRIDWFDLAVQGTLKSLLQLHSLKVSILWHSAFFMVQLSHLYMTTGKTIALTIQIFVGKIISLLFNQIKNGCML